MANQTIIQAARAAYAPAPLPDLSGYARGLEAISKVLIQAKKEKNAYDVKELKDFEAAFNKAPQLKTVLMQIKESDLSIDQKNLLYKQVVQQKDAWSNGQDNMAKIGDKLSSGVSPLDELYVNAIQQGGFDKEITFKSEDEEVIMNLGLSFHYEDGEMVVRIPNVDGTSTFTAKQFEAYSNSLARTSDGEHIKASVNSFIGSPRILNYESTRNLGNFNSEKIVTLDEMETLITEGNIKDGISGNRILTSAMFDKKFVKRINEDGETEKVNFIDYYLNNTELMPEELKKLFEEELEDGLTDEEKTIVKKILAQELIRLDSDPETGVRQDFLNWLETEVLDSYKIIVI